MGGWNRGRGRAMAWLLAHLDYRYDDCLKWPFSRDSHGYGQLGHEGKVFKAHRKMCEMKNGPAPSPDHEAAHSCNRGHQGCINPNHLSWKTRSANQQDRTDAYNLGCPRHKLTEEDVTKIRALFATETSADIARRYDVTPGLISKIKNGKLRTEGRKRIFVKFSDDQVRIIRSMFGEKPVREIAIDFGVKPTVIEKIRYGQSYKYVT